MMRKNNNTPSKMNGSKTKLQIPSQLERKSMMNPTIIIVIKRKDFVTAIIMKKLHLLHVPRDKNLKGTNSIVMMIFCSQMKRW